MSVNSKPLISQSYSGTLIFSLVSALKPSLEESSVNTRGWQQVPAVDSWLLIKHGYSASSHELRCAPKMLEASHRHRSASLSGIQVFNIAFRTNHWHAGLADPRWLAPQIVLKWHEKG